MNLSACSATAFDTLNTVMFEVLRCFPGLVSPRGDIPRITSPVGGCEQSQAPNNMDAHSG
jgi:hypothetical protein